MSIERSISPLGSLLAAIICLVAFKGSRILICATMLRRSFFSSSSFSFWSLTVILSSLRLVSVFCDGMRFSAMTDGIVAVIWLHVNAAGLRLADTCFLMSSVFLRICERVLVVAVCLYAFLDASRFCCQRRRVSTSTSTRRFPPLTISSPLFVIVCISVIIVSILISGVGCGLEVVLRGVRVGARISSISPRFRLRSFRFVAVAINCECLRLILRRDLYLFSFKPIFESFNNYL